MSEYLPYGKHYIDEEDIESVVDVLRNRNLTQGELVNEFEEAVAKYVGAQYAVAVSSWTSGLHLAVLAANVSAGDRVITSPNTFVSSANCSIFCGAIPEFSDIDPHTLNLDSDLLSEKINELKSVKALIPVHYAGLPCDMDRISAIAKKNDIAVIEDAAHALGAKYADGSMVGSSNFSLMTGFSFHPVKSIATGEGGMITTNNEEIYKKLIRLRSHGINKEDDKFQNEKNALTSKTVNPWYYEMQELGFNYRITDIQCALGISQLKKLDQFISRRRQLVTAYNQAFSGSELIRPAQINKIENSSHHIYPVRINFKKLKLSRAEIMLELQRKKILTQVHYIPVPMHPYYEKLNYKIEHFPRSQEFYDEALSLPLYYSLKDSDQERVINEIKSVIGI